MLQSWGVDTSKKVLLFVGSVMPHKQLRTLLEAMWWVERFAPQTATLALLGMGQDLWAAGVQTEIDRLGLQNCVVGLPELSDDALATLYSGVDLLISPSIIEGFGFPPLEALACGTPVLVSDIPVYRETLGGFAKFLTSWRYAEVAREILRTLTDVEYIEQCRTSGPDWSKKFSWRTCVTEHLALFVRLLEGKHVIQD